MTTIPEQLYAWFYRRRMAGALANVATVPAHVISVGNLTTGGTGKTPAVQWLAERLTGAGQQNPDRKGVGPQRVVILCRGYGGRLSETGAVVSDGSRLLLDAAAAGDEAVLHAQRLPQVPVIIGRDRVNAARIACELFHPDIILLDDGFQYWSLHRDLDLVLLDARSPFGNGHLLPAGRLREPPSALIRAGAVLLTRCDKADEEQLARTRATVASLTAAPVFEAEHRPYQLHPLQGGEPLPLDRLHGLPVWPLSAIADNAGFVATLRSCGAQIVGSTARGDHHHWRPHELSRAAAQAAQAGAQALVTTEKDAVKMNDSASGDIPTWSMEIKLGVRQENSLLALLATPRP